MLYIPIWFYSNGVSVSDSQGSTNALHSNLVLFKFLCPLTVLVSFISLHSNLVLFKYCQANLTGSPTSTLHSNLVLFKWYRGVNANFVEFTLHSNLVLFKSLLDRIKYIASKNFTFQSGSIQIIPTYSSVRASVPLHSNLVLFKYFKPCPIYTRFSPLHSNLVLFK